VRWRARSCAGRRPAVQRASTNRAKKLAAYAFGLSFPPPSLRGPRQPPRCILAAARKVNMRECVEHRNLPRRQYGTSY